MDKHTPLPWNLIAETHVYDNLSRIVFVMPPVSGNDDLRPGSPTEPKTKKANAAFIVRATNSYQELLNIAYEHLETLEAYDKTDPEVKRIKTIIAKAEGK